MGDGEPEGWITAVLAVTLAVAILFAVVFADSNPPPASVPYNGARVEHVVRA